MRGFEFRIGRKALHCGNFESRRGGKAVDGPILCSFAEPDKRQARRPCLLYPVRGSSRCWVPRAGSVCGMIGASLNVTENTMHCSSLPLAVASLCGLLATPAPAANNLLPRVPLGDLTPVEAEQSWGSLTVDRSVWGKPLRIGQRQFEHGLGTHANSRIVYELEGPSERYEAWVGLDAAMHGYKEGSIVFRVLADGRVAFDSGVMRVDTPAKHVNVPLIGIKELALVVTDAGDGINCDHADWADAVVFGQPQAAASLPGPKKFEVAASGLTVELAADGQFAGIVLGQQRLRRNVQGGIRLARCRTEGEVAAKRLAGGGLEFVRMLACPSQKQGCRVLERFLPTPTSVRWEVENPRDCCSLDDANHRSASVPRLGCERRSVLDGLVRPRSLQRRLARSVGG